MTIKIYAVVYQMGKVASTSLVATLNKHPDITAVQSHFLGIDLLKEILPSLVDSRLGDYFYMHQFGQFKVNIEITRQINLILDGEGESRLLILSLARDPVDWFRSSLVQDMQAYAPQLIDFALRLGINGTTEDDIVGAALVRVFQDFANILTTRGGIDAHFDKLRSGEGEAFVGTVLESEVAMQRIFRMMLRPYRWFEEHFERALKCQLSSFDHTAGVYSLHTERADYVVLRYEDIDQSFCQAMTAVGLDVPLQLEEKNISREKPFAFVTRAAFDSAAGANLIHLARRSAYSYRFGY
jgi:hypothetical protein